MIRVPIPAASEDGNSLLDSSLTFNPNRAQADDNVFPDLANNITADTLSYYI